MCLGDELFETANGAHAQMTPYAATVPADQAAESVAPYVPSESDQFILQMEGRQNW